MRIQRKEPHMKHIYLSKKTFLLKKNTTCELSASEAKLSVYLTLRTERHCVPSKGLTSVFLRLTEWQQQDTPLACRTLAVFTLKTETIKTAENENDLRGEK